MISQNKIIKKFSSELFSFGLGKCTRLVTIWKTDAMKEIDALGLQRVFLTLLLWRIITIVFYCCQNEFVAKRGLFRAELMF